MRALLCVLCLSVASVATAGPITFTVTGHGGLSGPVENLHDEMFWWVDTSGGVLSNHYASTGFSLVPGAVAAGYTPNVGTGSLLRSSAFTVAEGEELTFGMDVFAGMPAVFAVDTVGFAVLLKDGLLHSVLAAVQPNGRTYGSDGLGNFVPRDFAAPSPGVITSYTTILGPPPFTLGGNAYNTIPSGSTQSNTCCLTAVTSTVTPGAGTYQLLVGAYVYENRIGQMGVAVTNVTVPEPTTIAMLSVGLGLWIAPKVRKRRKRETAKSV